MVQLARMPGSQDATRNSKKRVELMSTMDILSSHLHTTFVALCTALAHGHDAATCNSDTSVDSNPTQGRTSRGYVTFVVGPNPGASKTHVVLVLDGLEVKAWDVREDKEDNHSLDVIDGPPSDDDSDEESEGEALIATEDAEVLQEDSEDCYSDAASDATPPPPSRSPSPSPSPPSSLSSSPLPTPPRRFGTSLAIPQSQLRHSSSAIDAPSPTQRSLSAPAPSYAENDRSLRAAERLLSRNLADANAEENGGMIADLGRHVSADTTVT